MVDSIDSIKIKEDISKVLSSNPLYSFDFNDINYAIISDCGTFEKAYSEYIKDQTFLKKIEEFNLLGVSVDQSRSDPVFIRWFCQYIITLNLCDNSTKEYKLLNSQFWKTTLSYCDVKDYKKINFENLKKVIKCMFSLCVISSTFTRKVLGLESICNSVQKYTPEKLITVMFLKITSAFNNLDMKDDNLKAILDNIYNDGYAKFEYLYLSNSLDSFKFNSKINNEFLNLSMKNDYSLDFDKLVEFNFADLFKNSLIDSNDSKYDHFNTLKARQKVRKNKTTPKRKKSYKSYESSRSGSIIDSDSDEEVFKRQYSPCVLSPTSSPRITTKVRNRSIVKSPRPNVRTSTPGL